MELTALKPGVIIRGPVIPEAIQVVAVIPMGGSTQILGKGLETGQFHDPIATSSVSRSKSSAATPCGPTTA